MEDRVQGRLLLGGLLTWEVRELVEEFILHAVELVAGVVGGGRGGRPLLLPLLLLGRPAKALARHADQSHGCSVRGGGGEQPRLATLQTLQYERHRSLRHVKLHPALLLEDDLANDRLTQEGGWLMLMLMTS